MMFYFDGIIVVEGKNDASYLSSFITSEYVVLNGYDMPKSEVDYLTHIKDRKILLLSDPDEAGREIAKKFLSLGIDAINIYIDITKCNKHDKHGVAECEREEILNKLYNYISKEPISYITISTYDFSQLGLANNKESQEKVSNYFHLGKTNTKTLFKRINYNHISKNEILEVLGDTNGNI